MKTLIVFEIDPQCANTRTICGIVDEDLSHFKRYENTNVDVWEEIKNYLYDDFEPYIDGRIVGNNLNPCFNMTIGEALATKDKTWDIVLKVYQEPVTPTFTRIVSF